jgi:hypothetical protein
MKLVEPNTNLVASLAIACPSKKLLERRLVQMGIGIIASLRAKEMIAAQACREFFNLDNYLEIKRRKLSKDLVELFEWGMELEDVTEISPDGVSDSFDHMAQLASRVMQKSNGVASAALRGRSRRSA